MAHRLFWSCLPFPATMGGGSPYLAKVGPSPLTDPTGGGRAPSGPIRAEKDESSAPGPYASPSMNQVERSALRTVAHAAIFGIVGETVAVTQAILTSAPVSPRTSFSVGYGAHVFLPESAGVLWIGAGLGVGGVVFGLLWLGYALIGFRTLSQGERRFRTPARLTVLGMVGIAVAYSGTLALLTQEYRWIQCAGGVSPIPVTCVSGQTVVALYSVELAGAILGVIGVLAALIGIWRFSARFNERRFKVGAVLCLVPFLDLIGFALVYVACRAVMARQTNVFGDHSSSTQRWP